MIFGQDRNELRGMYVDAWRKALADETMSPLEEQISAVVRDHPEYQALLTAAEGEQEHLEQNYRGDDGRTNPFLHMGLHLALREQLATNRPGGIRAIWNTLVEKSGDPHATEHAMIECLAESLWEASNSGSMPDERQYLARLERLSS